MSHYYASLSKRLLDHLANLLVAVGDRPLTDGTTRVLKDVSLRETILLVKDSAVYKTGEFKDINPDSFLHVFEKAGIDPSISLEEASIILNASYIDTVKPEGYQVPSFLRFAFKEGNDEDAPSVKDAAAQLVSHLVCVLGNSVACHQDFEFTRLQVGNPEHIRALSLS